jgi:diguanylate cyclase (GGDEF)-like protein
MPKMKAMDRFKRQPWCTSVPARTTSLHVLRLTIGAVFAVWTLLFGLMQIWEHRVSAEKYQDIVRLKAEMLYYSAQSLRSWIGSHGGVYVEVDKEVKPNPLLASVPDRDVVTPGGRHLTLYNSPAFLRQVMTEFEAGSGSRIRLVSRNPINPTNVPEVWERSAFDQLATKAEQVAELTTIDGHPFYRLMRPMILKAPCLGCHDYDKSAVGGLIGAVSISLDAGPDLALHQQDERNLLVTHTSMWLLGALGVLFGGWCWRQLLLRLEQAAQNDALTGLCNRRELMDRLEPEVATARRYDTALSLIMLDIDHFKRVNDSYGHQAGDDVLQALAKIMHNCLRISDLPARYGGEEFVIVCPHTDSHGARQIAERLRCTVEQASLTTRRGDIRLTISVGVAEFRAQDSVDELISLADQALYRAKQDGRNRVYIHRRSAEATCTAAKPVTTGYAGQQA